MGLRGYVQNRRAGRGTYWVGVVLGLGVLLSGVFGLVSYLNGNELARTGHRVSAVVTASDDDSVQLALAHARPKRIVSIRREGPSLCAYNYESQSGHATQRCDPVAVSRGDHIEVFVDRHDPKLVRPVDALSGSNPGTPILSTLAGVVIIGMCARALRRLNRGEVDV